MITSDFDSELFQSIVDTDLKDVEPYLEHLELTPPAQPVLPFTRFTVSIKASGSDLPCNGDWFKLTLAEQPSLNATIISQPKGEQLSFGVTGEWRVEIQAPADEGSYWLQIRVDSVETTQSMVEVPLTVSHTTSSDRHQPFTYKAALIATCFGTVFSALLLLISVIGPKKAHEIWDRHVINAFTQSPTIPETAISSSGVEHAIENTLSTAQVQPVVASTTPTQVDLWLKESFTSPNVFDRQKTWRQLSAFLRSQNHAKNPLVQKIQQLRTQHKQQLARWLTANENRQEALKRLQVLAYVDNDKNAQRWLGNWYSSGNGVSMHLGKAWQWYQRAANNGDSTAQQLLDDLELRADKLLNSQKLDERLRGYQVAEAAASAGGVNAQLWMAHRYESGDGVISSLNTAVQWYRMAASQDNAIASKKLALICKETINLDDNPGCL